VLKDIKSELALSEEESIGLMLYRDPQKMVKRVEVLHGEFPLESRCGVLQECCTICGEVNVINIKQQVYHVGAAVEDGQGGVRLGLNKSQGEEVCGEPVVPSPEAPASAHREMCCGSRPDQAARDQQIMLVGCSRLSPGEFHVEMHSSHQAVGRARCHTPVPKDVNRSFHTCA
jgi:hypothetical protein